MRKVIISLMDGDVVFVYIIYSEGSLQKEIFEKCGDLFTLQTKRLSSLVGWWCIASGGEIKNQMTLIRTCTKTIPEQIQSWDLGEIKLGLCADCLEALKMREIRLVLVSNAPYTILQGDKKKLVYYVHLLSLQLSWKHWFWDLDFKENMVVTDLAYQNNREKFHPGKGTST